MAQIREIKKRMTAVKTIQRITKTMQMIATAKFTSALAKAQATQPYTEKIRQLVAEVVAAAGDVDHPLITRPADASNKELLLVISSDRGLCGAYNAHVLRTSLKHLRGLDGHSTPYDLETSGKKAVGFFRFAKVPIEQRHTIGDNPGYDEVESLAARFIQEYTAGRYSAVRVAYMRFISNSRQVPEIMQLLPLTPPTSEEKEETSGRGTLYDFSPSAEELLDDLLPSAVKASLFQAFNDAVVSEQIMRMIAMKAATDNASSLGKTLKRDFNRARQTKITTELTEIVSGAAALE